MATQPIPTIQNGGGPLDNLLASISKNLGGAGTSTQTTSSAFAPQLAQLLANLTGGIGPYSKEAAIADASGPMAALAQETLQQYVPRAAAQVRGSGLYNSSTKALLDNDANAKLATAMAGLVQKNITDYATINANNVTAASNAARTQTTQTTKQGSSGGVGKQIASAAVPLLLNEGKKFLGGLFDNSTDTAASSASSVASALSPVFDGGSPVDRNSLLDMFGGVGSDTGGLGIDNTVLGDNGGLGDLLGAGVDTVTDAAGGLGDFLGNIGGGISDLFGSVTSGLGDLFGGLFADGGKVPVRDRGIGAAGDDRYGNGKKSEPAATSPGIANLLKELFPDNIFDRTQKKREKDSGLDTDAPAGKIRGPVSSSGLDNMLIGVQGGEGILPPDVMEVPGVEELLNTLIEKYHTPVNA